MLLTFFNSSAVNEFISARLGRFEMSSLFQAGTVSPTPVPPFTAEQTKALTDLGDQLCRLFRQVLTATETSRLFSGLQLRGRSLLTTIESAQDSVNSVIDMGPQLFDQVDRVTFDAYGFSPDSTAAIHARGRAQFSAVIEATLNGSQPTLTDIISYITGCSFGRWDIQYATGEKQTAELPHPFEPLPACPPAMLQNTDGLPAGPGDVLTTYPLRLSWTGILVDDEDHPEDIERRAREVLHVIWQDRAEAIEQEACQILDIRSLRIYFRKPAGFFADHLSRYSKSRRQAPIYWPLSTTSGSYTLWLYYPRLTSDTIYTAVNRYVEPKLTQMGRELGELEGERDQANGREAARLRERVESVQAFRDELVAFRDELLRVAALPYRPDLNDGVIINAAPLHRLFRLPKWAKDTKECWAKLERGEYDWAHLAYTIWPDRVREKCRGDKSLAIAHGLEELYVELPATTRKRT